MPHEVIELRIHGVGGATPQELLGVTSASDTVRVAGDEDAGFYARREDRHVEGYLWGSLNSRAWEQPAWILLLPFTLVNLAGWLVPAEAFAKRKTERAGDAVLFVFGLSITALYAMWIASISIDQLAMRWLYEGFGSLREFRGCDRPQCPPIDRYRLGYAASIAAGTVLAVGALSVLRWLARASQGKYESVASASDHSASITGARIVEGQSTLDDPGFWSRAADAHRLLVWHIAAAVVSVAMVAGWSLWTVLHVERAMFPGQLTRLFEPLLTVQVLMLGALLVLRAITWGFRGGRVVHTLGVPVLCGLALALGNVLLYGAGNLIYDRVHTGRPLVSLGIAVTAVAAASTLLTAFVVLRLLWRARRKACSEDQAPEHLPLGVEAASVTRGVRRATIRQELLAQQVTRSAWIFTCIAATFVVSLVLSEFGSATLGGSGTAEVARRLGSWLLWVAATALFVFMLRGFRKPSDRRPLAILWDVVSFWPRRFHPLGVRPYAERAVPEVEARLRRHLDDDRSVVVGAHSQGSVLAYSSFLRMARADPELLQRVAFVTYGTPLKNLYARYFPRYFSVARIDQLRGELGSPPGERTAWQNFFRSTDYVGQTVFSDTYATHEQQLPDPPEQPLVDHLPIDQPVPAGTDTPLAPFTKLSVHSRYTSEPAVRHWIDEVVRAALEDPPS